MNLSEHFSEKEIRCIERLRNQQRVKKYVFTSLGIISLLTAGIIFYLSVQIIKVSEICIMSAMLCVLGAIECFTTGNFSYKDKLLLKCFEVLASREKQKSDE